MDLWSVHVKMMSSSSHSHCHSQSPYLRLNLFSRKPISSFHLKKYGVSNWNRNLNSSVNRSLVVRSMGKKKPHNSSSSGNGDHSVPEEDGLKGKTPSSQGNKSNNGESQKSHNRTLDWREFRASLYLGEQEAIGGRDTHEQDDKTKGSSRLCSKWAHPLSSPEAGCVLVATEKLDGDRSFERTVIFLLGCDRPYESPYGVIINRPLHKKIKQMNPNNLDLATIFADCPVHFGGPVEASMFLLRASGKTNVLGFEEVIPGVCFGSRDRLDEAAALVKEGVLEPRAFRFLVGYAGWGMNQLREEIESGLWHVAACSSDLLFAESAKSSSHEGLWAEILQQMGGHYSELSRKPKQDM